MASDFPWFPLYVKDWLLSTATMTDEQAGAYMRLLCYAWEARGLPVDESVIQAIGRWTPAAWKRIWSTVGAKWERRGDRLVNPRQEEVRDEVQAFRAAKSASGKKGAAKRWQGHNTANSSAIPEPLANDSYPQPQPHPQGSVDRSVLGDPPRARVELGRHAALMPPPPKNAAFAGKFVVPDFLDAEFERKSHRSYDERQAWYRRLDDEWRDRPIGEDDLKFLRARFAEWVGPTVPASKAEARRDRNAASSAVVRASLRAEGALP